MTDATTLVLGRGEVFFEAFLPGTKVGQGERYIGNTTSFQMTRSIERLEKYRSFKGRKVKTDPITISQSHTVGFITDEISIENVAIWYGQEAEYSTVPAINVIEEIFVVVLGRHYQLGRSRYINGVRAVDTVTVRIGSDIIVPKDNYILDIALGRIFFMPDAANIINGQTATVSFEWRTTLSQVAVSKPRDVFGSLRFIARNVTGPQRNLYMPYVRLSPRGSVDLKGDEWQQIAFEVEALNLTPTVEQVYIETVMIIGTTQDEQAIIDFGGIPLSTFPPLEDQFNTTINVDIPNADYSAPV